MVLEWGATPEEIAEIERKRKERKAARDRRRDEKRAAKAAKKEGK